ncbi:site-specific integrase [Pseudomonas sp. 44 R 15]|uniref:site-specific integrase n=1 Tax=Pseudomonas sp. 44 R 15 TaxID=1844105 RepID=UPI000811EBA1|nr:site-specific integrase [Pseudomonas sp. 44 R 15]CRM67343.1 site-specific tyrosine recombinase XerC [Pseudomonas sp. 44 R 15]
MSRYKPQVVKSLSSDFTLPDTVDFRGKLTHRNAPDIPFVTSPNGHPCFFGNLYILHLYDQNYSIVDGGGSLTEFANQMSLLLNFVYDSQINLLEMTDSRFKNFRNWLRARRYRGRKTGVRRINRILLFNLEFLHFVGRSVGQPEFVSATGVIKAERIIKVSRRRVSGAPVLIYTWSHSCLLEDDGRSRTGHAMGDDTLEKLKAQIDTIKNGFIRRRTQVLVMLLEHTGGRRAEAGNFLVSKIRMAMATNELQPHVTMQSRKGLRNATREIPVDRHVLEDVWDFIETERRTLLHIKKIPELSCDMLFISERTGQPLSIKYITTTFNKLKKAAGITEKAHAHQLRHLYISKKFEELVLDAIGASTSPLRSLDTIMAAVAWEIMQYSGHKDRASLDTYVKTIKSKLFNMLVERATNVKQLKPALNTAINSLMEETSEMTPEELEEFLELKIAAIRASKNS